MAAGKGRALPPLTDSESALVEPLASSVHTLSEAVGERNIFRGSSLVEAARWVEDRMAEAGFEAERQDYELSDRLGDALAGTPCSNLIAEVTGRERPEEIVVIGAHYDSVIGSPGANDNASAVAALLALARWFRDRPQPRTLRFAAFVNEEPPFFMSPDMGSYRYAARCEAQDEEVTAMMAMDGIGYYSDAKGSQHFPLPGLGLMYPDRGHFIAFATRLSDRSLMKTALKAFRSSVTMPAEGASLPAAVPGVSWSDHWSFWQHGIPAFLVTDTLPLRDPQYHRPGDTADRLDYERMARVVEGLKAVAERLAA